MAMSRVNLNFPEELKDYVKSEADKYGLSLTSMIIAMIMQYRKQDEAMQVSKMIEACINLKPEGMSEFNANAIIQSNNKKTTEDGSEF